MFTRSYIRNHQNHSHYFSDAQLLSLRNTFSTLPDHGSLAFTLKNLSDPTKLNIYLLLYKVNEMPVTDMARVLVLSQSAVSHALTDLKQAGIVESKKCGRLRCYSLKKQPSEINSLLSFIKKLVPAGGTTHVKK
jgi:DNA-binding transcriptional ArsR family regulator